MHERINGTHIRMAVSVHVDAIQTHQQQRSANIADMTKIVEQQNRRRWINE